ncbi:MAG: penicillin-binding protein 1A [Pseudomonadota bacterium]|nr:penicillin-binding protein 1A [Pseudomonadota bacterium]
MAILINIVRGGFIAFFVLSVIGMIVALGAYLYLAPGMPPVSILKDVQLQVPLRVYSRDGGLITEYGEKRRKPLRFEQIPEQMRQAFLAAEDDRFFVHPGVDYHGILRAAIELVRTGEKGQGGSTITMQLARNFFLTRERTYIRKLREIFLALNIERELTKEEILELYLNKIYLGHRAYGVGAAAEVYYGKNADALDLAQIAMIAGLPKAPSAYNPVTDPTRAILRRDYVLRRMLELKYLDDEDYSEAKSSPVTARLHRAASDVQAPYLGEMARAEMVSRFGSDAYNGGYEVYTTVDSRLQAVAEQALANGLVAYGRRHGYRGPIGKLDPEQLNGESTLVDALAGYQPSGGLLPGIVLSTDGQQAEVFVDGVGRVTIVWEGLSWARPYIDATRMGDTPAKALDVVAPGDIIRVRREADSAWSLSEIPSVAGALVSLDANDGAIVALVGGFDYYTSKFNRVIQARRQPGSSFKPFIYSAALEQGMTPASVINDAPVVFSDSQLESTWRPENYSGRFHGPTRLRVALTKSRNLVSIRMLRQIGVAYALEHGKLFGFDTDRFPRNLSIALGSGEVTPLELATGYAVFANGGFRVEPYFIEKIVKEGETVYEANPSVACPDTCEYESAVENGTTGKVSGSMGEGDAFAEVGGPLMAQRVISPENAFQMVSMMRDVIRRGTGRKAMELGRSDLAGKTGTTNDQHDAWFSGFNADLVTVAWVGFDENQTLGARETGGVAALPVWMDYMREALDGSPEHSMSRPDGMVTVRIDPETGDLAGSGVKGAIFETFRADHVPEHRSVDRRPVESPYGGTGTSGQDLF